MWIPTVGHLILPLGLLNRITILRRFGPGVSRSASCVAAYLLKYHASVDAALSYLRSCRECASPNSGFLRQLAEFHRRLHVGRLAWTPHPATEEKKTTNVSTSSPHVTSMTR